ncbi:MAG: DUF1854 domain-containing protein [Gallionella sp.]|nr:DUF1854 domain-containing protein [Gallionella sp.]
MSNFTLQRNAAGRLEFTSCQGDIHQDVVPVRAFPIAAPEEGISLTSSDGHELAWIENLADLSAEIRTLLEEELGNREFTPEIQRINQVSSFATPSTWQIATDRGATELHLKAEDHIRRLPPAALLITDSHGVSFRVRDMEQLDAHSRKLLDRFL